MAGALVYIIHAVAVAGESVPTNMLLIGGFAKCGTSHLHRVLADHPKVFALRKELKPLPGKHQMFEEVIFFYAREVARVDVSSPVLIRDACRNNFNDNESKQECLRALPGKDDSLPAKKDIAPKILLFTHINFHRDPVLMERWGATVKTIYLVRDPAEYLWAAFNYWRTDLDANSAQKTSVGNFYRSPELFHELLLADGLLKWKMGLNGRTGEWFFLLQNETTSSSLKEKERLLLPKFHLLLRSEDLLDPHLTALALGKISSFTGLKAEDFNSSSFNTRTNAGYSASSKGILTVSEQTMVQSGVYELSGYRPMLCKTRIFIYQNYNAVCQVLDMMSPTPLACQALARKHAQKTDLAKRSSSSRSSIGVTWI